MGKIAVTLFIFCIIAFQMQFAIAIGHLEFSGMARHNDQPVSDATVTLYALGSTKKKLATEQTGYNGKFSFRIDFDKMYRIEWKKTGYTEMVILINGFVPASENGWIMSYAVNFDVFKHKAGHETKMERDPVIQVSYSSKEENFSQVGAYSNTSTYIRLDGADKDPVKEENEVSTKDESEDNIAAEPTPATEEEKEFIKETEGQIKQSEFKKEIAESANELEARELALKQQEKEMEEKRLKDLKASQLKESLARERERARKEVIKNRSARSNSQEDLMKEIADMMREDKKKKP